MNALKVKFHHSHKKRKDSLETRTILLIFSLELEISGVAVQKLQWNSKKWWLFEELLSENNFEGVLVTLCCRDFDANASVQKIAADQNDNRKWSSYVIVYWISKIYQLKNVKKRSVTYLLGHLRRRYQYCRNYTEKGALTGPWWVSSEREVR